MEYASYTSVRFIHLSLSEELIREIRLMKLVRSSRLEYDAKFNVPDVKRIVKRRNVILDVKCAIFFYYRLSRIKRAIEKNARIKFF